MNYPENERILIVRPCLKTICLGVKPAAKLLSALLYQARNCSDDEPSFTIQWTQEQVIKAVCEEFTTKTLHDTAIPCLELLGYLDVDTSSYVYHYTVHLDLIHRALEVYGTPELEKVLIVSIRSQLEKVLNELEKVPIQLEEVLNELEKLLIVIRKSSNCNRGRKARPHANSEAISKNPRLQEIDESTKEERESTPSSLQLDAPPLSPSQKKKPYVAPVLSQQTEEEHQRVLALFGRPCDTCGRSITTPDCPWCATVRVPAVVPPKHQPIPPLTGRVAAVAASSLPTPLSDAAPAPPGKPEAAPAQPALVALPAKRPRKKPEPLPAMSEEATCVWQRWRSLFTREMPLTRRDMEAAEQLAACTPTAEELGGCRKWLFTTDNPERPWYRRIGVGLPDVAKNWTRWQSLQDAPPIDLQLVKKAEGPRLPPPMPSDEELRKQVY